MGYRQARREKRMQTAKHHLPASEEGLIRGSTKEGGVAEALRRARRDQLLTIPDGSGRPVVVTTKVAETMFENIRGFRCMDSIQERIIRGSGGRFSP